MASKFSTAHDPERVPREDPLVELGRGLLAQGARADPVVDVAPWADEAAGPAAGIRLDLRDLIRDDNGEVVLYNDSGLRHVDITTPVSVVAEGQSQAHVTAAGEDVSGFRFLSFDNGLTLYYQQGLEVAVHHDPC